MAKTFNYPIYSTSGNIGLWVIVEHPPSLSHKVSGGLSSPDAGEGKVWVWKKGQYEAYVARIEKLRREGKVKDCPYYVPDGDDGRPEYCKLGTVPC